MKLDLVTRDKAEVAEVANMIAPPGLVPEFPPNLAKARAGHDAMARIFPVLDGTICSLVELGGIIAEQTTPPQCKGSKIIMYLHGWGFALGSIDSHRHLVAQLCQASGAVAYSLGYRLAPETVFPGAINDGVTAYCALLALGHAAEDIIIAGDSSGGGLALSMAVELRERNLPQPAGLFLMSPWVDLSLGGSSHEAKADVDFMCNKAELTHWARLYVGDGDIHHPLASPVFNNLKGLAPMLIHVGTEEILLSDSLQLAEQAGLAGVQIELKIGANMPHTWHYMWPFLSAARASIAQAGCWIATI
jgi:epsilon-lactone hydrolase